MDITIHSPAPFTWNVRSMVSHWESKGNFIGPETPLDMSSQCKGTCSKLCLGRNRVVSYEYWSNLQTSNPGRYETRNISSKKTTKVIYNIFKRTMASKNASALEKGEQKNIYLPNHQETPVP